MGASRILRRFFALGRGERWLALRAYAELGTIALVLRVTSFRWTIRRLQGHAPSVAPPDDAHLERARRYAHVIERVARHHPLGPRCLHRSLLLHRWLRREGVPSELRIGVRKGRAGLMAHAWVEIGDQVVNDPPTAVAPFTPLASPGSQVADRERLPRGLTAGYAASANMWSE